MPRKQGLVKAKKLDKKGKEKAESKKKREEFSSYMFRFKKPSRKIGRGGVMPKTKALGRLIRWPKYVKLQRQQKVLLQRLKIPPSLNIFNAPIGRLRARAMLRLFRKYRPETRKEKKDRLRAKAKEQAEQKPLKNEKPFLVKFGFNHVTELIEAGRAKLVLIAHDVDPIELVMWMPTLCVKKDIPFAIFRGKSRLGALVHQKTASCLALCDVRPGDQKVFDEIVKDCRAQYNDRFNYLKKRVGQKIMGVKTRHKIAKRRRYREAEAKKRRAAQQGETKETPNKKTETK